MAKKIMSIYDMLNDYDEKTINFVIDSLSSEEKDLLFSRYGSDLHNPVTNSNWDKERSKKFYNVLIPKIKKVLKNTTSYDKSFEKKVDVSSSFNDLDIKFDSKSSLMDLLNSGKTNKELCEELGISEKELYKQLLNLKNMGIHISKKYYFDGSIEYNNISSLKNLKQEMVLTQDRTIITSSPKNKMKFLAISDLHFGNSLARIDLVDRAFNYCKKMELILFCVGEIFLMGLILKVIKIYLIYIIKQNIL